MADPRLFQSCSQRIAIAPKFGGLILFDTFMTEKKRTATSLIANGGVNRFAVGMARSQNIGNQIDTGT
jgi:hypothetical protein